MLKKNVVDEVIIAIPRSMLTDAEPIAQACEEEGIKLRFMADLFNLEVARTKLITLGKIPLLTMEPVAQDEIKLMVKTIHQGVSRKRLKTMSIRAPISQIQKNCIKMKCELLP